MLYYNHREEREVNNMNAVLFFDEVVNKNVAKEDFVVIEIQCPFCGQTHSVRCSESGFYEWESGELIQRALPELNATEREQLISRICPDCQKKIFGE